MNYFDNPLVGLMSLQDILGSGQGMATLGNPGQATPTQTQKPAAQPPASPPQSQLDLGGLMEKIFGNTGKALAPGASVGSVAPPSINPGFDPFSYGQTGGEQYFYGNTPGGGMAPISALGSLGGGTPQAPAPAPAAPVVQPQYPPMQKEILG